jgi:hypothetical protein
MKRFLFLSLLAIACTDEQPYTMRWSMAGQPCDQAGVRTVHVFIGDLGPGSYDRDIDCAVGEEAPGLRMFGLAPGRHTFVIKGFGNEVMKFWHTGEIDIPAGPADLGVIDLETYVGP